MGAGIVNANALHALSLSQSTNRKQQHHQQQFTRKLIDTQSVCECVPHSLCLCVCAIRPKVLNAPTLLGRYFIGCQECMAVRERERERAGARRWENMFITVLFIENDRILCKLTVFVGAKLQQSCPSHTHCVMW